MFCYIRLKHVRKFSVRRFNFNPISHMTQLVEKVGFFTLEKHSISPWINWDDRFVLGNKNSRCYYSIVRHWFSLTLKVTRLLAHFGFDKPDFAAASVQCVTMVASVSRDIYGCELAMNVIVGAWVNLLPIEWWYQLLLCLSDIFSYVRLDGRIGICVTLFRVCICVCEFLARWNSVCIAALNCFFVCYAIVFKSIFIYV